MKFKIVSKPKRFKLRAKSRKFKLRKVFKHEPVMEPEELHDDEKYSFFESSVRAGYRLRTVDGYELRYGWERFEKAFESHPMKSKDSTWISVKLPNKKFIVAQPASSVPQKEAA